jgi:hypothetical protein
LELTLTSPIDKGRKEKMTMKATTPKQREVIVHDVEKVGTGCHSGKLSYGNVPVAFWCTTGTATHSLEEALIQADEKIDACGLHE